MPLLEAREEYQQALRMGLREQKSRSARGESAHPMVLDRILDPSLSQSAQHIGTMEIPSERIVGVKSAGRIAALSSSFLPLLDEDTEFAHKWINLCDAHLSSGIREPIICYEYLGNFYVQEGNKRVSVLRYFGAPRILATVLRILPEPSEDPQIKAYYEFLDFYSVTGLYQVQFRQPGDYAQLLAFLGKSPDSPWNEREKRTFTAYFQYFRDAFFSLHTSFSNLLPEEALLMWLRVYPFRELGELSSANLKKTLAAMSDDFLAIDQEEPVQVQTEPGATDKANLLSRIISGTPSHLNVAFVHPLDPSISNWISGHDAGRQYLQDTMEDQVTIRSYFHADSPEAADALLEQAVADGADVVFTTTPQLSRPTLRAAVTYPKVRFLNCSVDIPYSSIRTYYGRIFEAKFITGAIAGAMANDDKIGYIGSSPIFGVPASINAFALGAQLTNPRAKIMLRWSCQKGSHQADFFNSGIRVVSNRDVPTQDPSQLHFCNYGTYQLNDHDQLEPLASPVWVWGKFYEQVVRAILGGTFDKDKNSPRAINYWWGMDSGVIDVSLSELLPPGVCELAKLLRRQLRNGSLDPFHRHIVAQDGTVKNDGSRTFTPEELLHMDWLCENVDGSIPTFDQIEPFAQPMVRELGLYRDEIPMETEGAL